METKILVETSEFLNVQVEKSPKMETKILVETSDFLKSNSKNPWR